MKIDKYFHMYGTKDKILFEEVEKPEQRWIPCSERPPEEEGEYLISVKYKPIDGYEDVYTEDGEWLNGKWIPSNRHCGEVESILAWKPMPEPYKENSDG